MKNDKNKLHKNEDNKLTKNSLENFKSIEEATLSYMYIKNKKKQMKEFTPEKLLTLAALQHSLDAVS